MLLLIEEGFTVLIFAKTNSLRSAIVVIVIFSLFVRASCAGATHYGIVPYVDLLCTGSVTAGIVGIVGAGANCGAVGFGIAFRYMIYEKAF
jgi:hypothetical protein